VRETQKSAEMSQSVAPYWWWQPYRLRFQGLGAAFLPLQAGDCSPTMVWAMGYSSPAGAWLSTKVPNCQSL